MKIIDEKTIESYIKRGERLIFKKDVRLMPSAEDLVKMHGLTIIREEADYIPAQDKVKRVVIGSDHGGFELKQSLIKQLETAGYTVIDIGPNNADTVDYPDFALAVARHVAAGKADRGVMIDSIGVASAMVANKVRGVRAAPCWNTDVAKSARSHNDGNVITLGGKIFTPFQAWEILQVFLTEHFSGGRHEKRVRKIEAVSKI